MSTSILVFSFKSAHFSRLQFDGPLHGMLLNRVMSRVLVREVGTLKKNLEKISKKFQVVVSRVMVGEVDFESSQLSVVITREL